MSWASLYIQNNKIKCIKQMLQEIKIQTNESLKAVDTIGNYSE